MQRYPPHSGELEILADFFDQVDSNELEGLEEVPQVPEREMVNVSLRLPRQDMEVLKQVAAREGVTPTTFMRWVLRRFVRSLTSRQRQ